MDREFLPYAEARKEFQPGDCITWEGRGFLGWLIGLFTRSRTTHVSVLLMQVREVERWLIMEAWEGGHGFMSGVVGANFLSTKVAEYKGKAVWRPLQPRLDEYRPAITKVLWVFKGAKYDYWSLFRQALRRVGVCTKSLFCSELAQVAYRQIPADVLKGSRLSDELELLYDDKAMQPRDFENLPLFSREVELT